MTWNPGEVSYADIMGDNDGVGDNRDTYINGPDDYMGGDDVQGIDIIGEIVMGEYQRGGEVGLARRVSNRAQQMRLPARQVMNATTAAARFASNMQQRPAQRPPQQRPPVLGFTGGERIGERRPDIARVQVSPLPQNILVPGAGSTQSVTFRPMRPLRIERLVLEAFEVDGAGVVLGVSFGVGVAALTVGADPQFVNDGIVPISTFSNNAVGVALRGNTVNPGVDVTITFFNGRLNPVNIVGAIIGTSLTD